MRNNFFNTKEIGLKNSSIRKNLFGSIIEIINNGTDLKWGK